MANWNNPTITSLYTDWETELKARDDSLAKMFDDGVSWSNLPSGAIKWNSGSSRFEKWNGSTWANLSTALTDVCKTANNLSDLASASTARTNLGLGTIAVVNSPVPVANGGTGDTTASGARTNLGLGTMATQAASAVAITGGSLSGITALTMNNSTTLGWVSASGGLIDNVGTVQNGADLTFKAQASGAKFYWFVNSVSELTLDASALYPSSNNGLDLGTSGNNFNSVYANQTLVNYLGNLSGDIAVRFSGTARWYFNSSGYAFRPAGNGTQDVGATSSLVNNVYCNRILAAAGLGVQFNGNNVEYLALSTGSHRFYNGGGGTEMWKIDGADGGKLKPVYIGQQDYTVSGFSFNRTLDNSTASVSRDFECRRCLASLIGDLTSLGFFQ